MINGALDLDVVDGEARDGAAECVVRPPLARRRWGERERELSRIATPEPWEVGALDATETIVRDDTLCDPIPAIAVSGIGGSQLDERPSQRIGEGPVVDVRRVRLARADVRSTVNAHPRQRRGRHNVLVGLRGQRGDGAEHVGIGQRLARGSPEPIERHFAALAVVPHDGRRESKTAIVDGRRHEIARPASVASFRTGRQDLQDGELTVRGVVLALEAPATGSPNVDGVPINVERDRARRHDGAVLRCRGRRWRHSSCPGVRPEERQRAFQLRRGLREPPESVVCVKNVMTRRRGMRARDVGFDGAIEPPGQVPWDLRVQRRLDDRLVDGRTSFDAAE